MIELRPYQAEGLACIWDYFSSGNTGNPVIAWPTGCHAKDTEILMYDGSIKLVQNVELDDLLMGPDSKPRRVLSLARGHQSMVKIIPVKGKAFVVNAGHILSLKTTNEKNKAHFQYHFRLQKGEIENIHIWDYVEKSKWYKHTRKLWRVGVNFNNKHYLPLDAYFLGMFLGDGSYSHDSINFTSQDEVLINKFTSVLDEVGNPYRIQSVKNKTKLKTVNVNGTLKQNHNDLYSIFNFYGFKGKRSGEKFIPDEYKTASRQNRLAILAGLLDTDGHLSTGGYDYISKSEQLANDVVFIARSLGFAAYVAACFKKAQTGNGGIYYRVSIYGEGLEQLPMQLEYKKASPRLQKKDALVTGFKMELMPEDSYFGFELDKDHLYLTGDFTVHHNTGKSIVPAIFIRYVMGQWPQQRFLMVTHVKELIQQNFDVLKLVWPNAPVSIYSAGLGLKNPAMPIVFGGVQSMSKHPALFGHRDIIFIDEAHLINQHDTSMYKTFLSTMKLINPNVKIIGMSATPFRMGWGLITDSLVDEHGNDGRLFTDIVHDITGIESFNRLIAEGYLAPLIPLRTHQELDVSEVGMNKGEFIANQLQAAVDKKDLNYKICQEIVKAGENRKAWLIFSSGIEHAEHIADTLLKFGVVAAPVHSKKHSDFNDDAIKSFKEGNLRAIVNYGKLTTGFNYPQIDLIGMVRPTLSVPLWVQMLGRGTRPAEGKANCLVLDFAKNTLRLGPINDPVIPRKKGAGAGDVPVKLCDSCGAYNHTRVQFCCQCGAEFQFRNKLVAKASTEALLKSDLPIVEDYNVTYPTYAKKQKDGGSPYILVTYHCGLQAFKEFIFPEGKGPSKHKYHLWWRQRANIPPPETVDGVLAHTKELAKPKKITVWVNKKYPEVLRAEF